MPTGKVKWFNPGKGYGFIQPDGGGPDVFVHSNALAHLPDRSLRQDQRVTFDVAKANDDSGRVRARNVKTEEGSDAAAGRDKGMVGDRRKVDGGAQASQARGAGKGKGPPW